MFIKRVKPFLMVLGISAVSLGTAAGLILPAGARSADIVAPTTVLSGAGALCPNQVTIATLLPGDAIEGSVVVTAAGAAAPTGASSPTNINDTNTAFSREFTGSTPQPFSILNNTATVDVVQACNRLATLTTVIHGNMIKAGSARRKGIGTINIKVDASAINNNNNATTIELLNRLYNRLYGRNRHHHHNNNNSH
ncbi:hypothetical protein KDW_27400 [Dictyobacter vulcani]|uniref:Uncharacterized protein n=1 Tax=Dictyobacter vulcani TaxID=2607529 RepID=A0A5J4KG79_9CHLR|nr:hypothetical protein [Dictyobacter vulcani]GER88578.1 hypothetical protein KDW_27400 [Dictyobacter vulcani]